MSNLINEGDALLHNKYLTQAKVGLTNDKDAKSQSALPDEGDSAELFDIDESLDPQIDPNRIDPPIDHDHEGLSVQPLIEVSEHTIEVAAGQAARAKVTVQNVGTVVQTYDLTVLGPARHWISMLPAEISLFPGESGSAIAVIKPPKSSALLAGRYEIGVRATSKVLWTEQATVEFGVVLLPYHLFKASLSRTSLDIKRPASTYLSLTNEGNSAVTFMVSMSDPDGRLTVNLDNDKPTLGPGETAWINARVSGPLHFIGKSVPGSVIATADPVRDVTSGTKPLDVKPYSQRISVNQQPVVRLRLGWLGRMVIVLALLALVATFVLSRFISADRGAIPNAPIAPADFSAALQGTSDVVLTWQPSTAAASYHIYAVGGAADPAESSQSPETDSTASPTASTAANSVAFIDTNQIAQLVNFDSGSLVVAGGEGDPSNSSTSGSGDSQSPSPQASSDPTLTPGPTEEPSADQLSPVCVGCTSITALPAGSTRYLVQNVKPDIKACYRIVALAGTASSLFSKQTCVQMPTAQAVAAAAAAASAAAGGSDS